MSRSSNSSALYSKRILVVEDELLIASDVTEALLGVGATVVGPVGALTAAMRLSSSERPIDAALLDVSLRDGMVYPLLDQLRDDSVPVLLYTGRDRETLKPPYDKLPLCEKPVPLPVLLEMLCSLWVPNEQAANFRRCGGASPNPS